jgi:membrane protease YdiL (CAAX protease family)
LLTTRSDEIDKAVAAWEIASVTSSFLLAAWLVPALSMGRTTLSLLPLSMGFALMFLSHRWRRESPQTLGFRIDNFLPAIRLVAAPTILAVCFFTMYGFYMGTIRTQRSNLVTWLVTASIWALIQQYVLQGYLNRRAIILMGRGFSSVLLVATLFALLHLPNLWLSILTFVGGLIWAVVYQRTPNIFALAISHAVVAIVLAMTLPNWVVNNLRIGIKFFG